MQFTATASSRSPPKKLTENQNANRSNKDAFQMNITQEAIEINLELLDKELHQKQDLREGI